MLPCFGGSLSTPGYGLSCLIIRGGVIKTVVPIKEVATALPCLDALLLPALNSSLACWGRSLSLLPGCLAAYPLVTTSTVTSTCPLGFPLTEMNKSLISCVAVPRLPSSPTVPFLSTGRASRLQRLRLFHALVTASFRWSLCVLSLKQGVLQRLRVHCVTLLTWLLGGRAHFAWFDVECLQTSFIAQCEALGPHHPHPQ